MTAHGRPASIGLVHRPSLVALLRADPDLGAGIPAAQLGHAERVVVSERHRLDAGRWEPGEPADATYLILDGVIAREIDLVDRRCLQLLGPGDLLRPGPDADLGVPAGTVWTALGPASLATLDGRFMLAARRWPSLAEVVQSRLLAQLDRLALDVAIAHLTRIELRVLAVLWHLAGRWGRVTPQGVLVPLPLTHDMLGRLAGAQRPTVTIAVTQLAHDGAIERSVDGWLLAPDSTRLLEWAPSLALVS
jgi:CRP-like cAMP-binding protein